MMDFGALMKVKQAWGRFSNNHPKVQPFINDIKRKGAVPGQEIAIAVRYPDGTEYKTGIRVQQDDLELLNIISNLAQGM